MRLVIAVVVVLLKWRGIYEVEREEKAYGRRQERLRRRVRERIYELLNRRRGDSWQKDIGCSGAEFRAHLEGQFSEGMTWLNYGSIWEVGHIKGLGSFDLSVEAEWAECNHFRNVRPRLCLG